MLEAHSREKEKMGDVAQKVYQLYYGILLANEINALMDRALKALDETIQKAEKEEFPNQVEILKYKTIMFELYKQLDESNRKQELAKRALRIQMGYAQDSPLEFKLVKLAPLPDKLDRFSQYVDRTASAGIKRTLLDTGIEAKKRLYQIEKRKVAPSVAWGSFFEFGHAPGIQGEEDDSSFNRPFNYKKAGLGLQLEGEFDWPTIRSRVNRSQAEYYQALLQKKAAIEGIELELQEAYLDAVEKRNLMERSQNAQKISHQLVFLTKSNLDIGVGEKKDYTDALQSYLIFQGRYYEAVYNYNSALIKLKKISGALDDELLELNGERHE